MVKSKRIFRNEASVERRCYIILLVDFEQFAYAVLNHWLFENQLHRRLDFIFEEDAGRIYHP